MAKEQVAIQNEWLEDLQELKLSYRHTLAILKMALAKALEEADGMEGKHPDEYTLRGAISDCNFIIDWLHTGRMPGNRRGIERRSAYQREKLMDPVRMQAYMQHSTAGSPSNITDWQRFEIKQALELLSARERECYQLVHGEGYSLGYAAQMLKISKGTVFDYVKRAQKKVTDYMNQKLTIVLK